MPAYYIRIILYIITQLGEIKKEENIHYSTFPVLVNEILSKCKQ